MKKFMGTPGPWETSFTDCLGGPASYCRIRPVSGEMYGMYTSLEIATMNMMLEAEQQANARLIEAAPELLEALQGLIDSLDHIDTSGEMDGFFDACLTIDDLRNARAANAKALGE